MRDTIVKKITPSLLLIGRVLYILSFVLLLMNIHTNMVWIKLTSLIFMVIGTSLLLRKTILPLISYITYVGYSYVYALVLKMYSEQISGFIVNTFSIIDIDITVTLTKIILLSVFFIFGGFINYLYISGLSKVYKNKIIRSIKNSYLYGSLLSLFMIGLIFIFIGYLLEMILYIELIFEKKQNKEGK